MRWIWLPEYSQEEYPKEQVQRLGCWNMSEVVTEQKGQWATDRHRAE